LRDIGLLISYDGTAYCGFQAQPNLRTIQQELQDAIHVLTGEEVKVVGSGRTDSGVHAMGQVIQFQTTSAIPIERWKLALNARLPQDIVIRAAVEAPPGFDVIRSATRKTYRYTINNNRIPDIFHRRLQFHHPTPLNLTEMIAGLEGLLGEHDFSSFCSRKSTKSSHVRTLYEATIITEKDSYPDTEGRNGVFHIFITGNGFLYNMVRIIVGTLLQVGEGKRTAEDMMKILESRDRGAAGPTAIAQGLCLWQVDYDLIKFT